MRRIAKRLLPVMLVILTVACLIVPAYAATLTLHQKTTCITQPAKTTFSEFYKTAGAQKVGVIPGISTKDKYLPQGMTYWAAKDWLLIGMQSLKDNDSAIVAIERSTGKFVGEWFWQGGTSHMGGIAATEYNLYITSSSASVVYVPLSTLEALGSSGSFVPTKVFSIKTYMNTAPISYMGYDNDSGVMVLGNYFYSGKSDYNKPARSDYSSILFGYDLSSCTSSASEISLLKSLSLAPSFMVGFDSKIDKIQGAVYHNGQLILSRSYGNVYSSYGLSGYVSTIDCFNVDVASLGNTYTLTDANGVQHTVPLYVTGSTPNQSLKDLPMSEGIVAVGDNLYINYESGVTKNCCLYATDYVWVVPIAKI